MTSIEVYLVLILTGLLVAFGVWREHNKHKDYEGRVFTVIQMKTGGFSVSYKDKIFIDREDCLLYSRQEQFLSSGAVVAKGVQCD